MAGGEEPMDPGVAEDPVQVRGSAGRADPELGPPPSLTTLSMPSWLSDSRTQRWLLLWRSR